jgi:hypothetical protein
MECLLEALAPPEGVKVGLAELAETVRKPFEPNAATGAAIDRGVLRRVIRL